MVAGSRFASWQESPVVLQSSTRSEATLYTLYLVANSDASQDSMLDWLPLYFTFCGGQGTERETVKMALMAALRENHAFLIYIL